MKSAFLPVGLIAALVASLLLPAPGATLQQWGLIPWTVVVIFLVNGYQTQLKELPREQNFFKALLAGAIISLLISPFVGLLIGQLFGLSAGLLLGLVVKSAMPSTLSTCIVMTQLAGGYALWALLITVILNLLGVFTVPFMLSLTLADAGQFEIAPWPLLQQLLMLVLLPLIVGFIARQISSVPPDHLILQYLPSSCIILAVWMSLSSSADVISALHWNTLIKVALAALSVHFLLMVISWLAGKALKLPYEELIALVMTASQKTLPVAVSVLAALNQPIAEALLVCVLFHFLMLLADAVIVPRLRQKLAT